MKPDKNLERWSRRQLLQRGAAATAGLVVAPMTLFSSNAHASDDGNDLLATLRRGHPRLLATPGAWQAITKRRGEDALLDAFLKRGETEARAILTAPPVIYEKQGKRLLHVSRTALRRVLLLALHFHLTGDAALARRAENEMRAAAAFGDWNPSHFLDVGEMTAALALGYDWLYDTLDADARSTIVAAIVEKGLRPGLSDTRFAQMANNWNSVCLGGMTLGALAVAEIEPALAAQTLLKTKNNNFHGLKPYAPDGVYPEGAMYWGYGTTFQTVLVAALETALGTDWGLSRSPGFRESGAALIEQLGPTGAFFNFSDNVERPGLEAGMWWFARTLHKPELLRYDLAHLKDYAASTRPPQPATEADRLLPLAALWWPETSPSSTTAASLPRFWYGHGPNPLVVFRDAWDDPKAMFLALKGGKATLSHGHMDAGSFVFEASGVRWARDLGAQDYLSLESKGVDLWNSKQDSQRWDVFRLGPFSHNTLTINDARHVASGPATVTHFSDGDDPGAVLDLSPVFEKQASRVTRGFAFRPHRHVLIRDEVAGLKPGDTVRWALLTRAEITLPETSSTNDNTSEAILREADQTLRVHLQSSVEAKFEVISAETPPHDYDARNPGVRQLVVQFTAPASGALDWSVVLQPQPGETPADPLAQTVLSRWPQPPAK